MRTNVKSILIKFGIVAAMGLLVFAAACGGDDDDEGGDSTPVSQATSASTAAATVAAEPTDAPDDGGGSSDQPQFSEMSAETQSGVNTLCMIAADPVAGLSQATNINLTLAAAQAGQFGPEIGEAAGPLSDAYAGTDPAAFDAAVADMKTVCDDIGWTPS
jgi:hypothetical protein